MDLVLKIYDVEDEDLQGRLEEIAKQADDYSSGIMDDGVVWELTENDNLLSLLDETKKDLLKEIKTLEKHERDCGEDMSNDISYNRGYIGAIDYVIRLLSDKEE